jgi:hypothetical protein
MQISPAVVDLPGPVRKEMGRQPQGGELVPGFLVGVEDVLAEDPALQTRLSQLQVLHGLSGTPCLVVGPEQTRSIFEHENELDLLKTIAGQVAGLVHPHLKTGIDGVWLVYKAARLYKDWARPDRDTVACLFKAAGLTLGTMGVVGSLYPGLRIPDHWANGINYVVRSGQAIHQGRTPPINEMMLSSDKRLAIPLKLLKVAGISLDPSPQYQAVTAMPLIAASRARLKPAATAPKPGGTPPAPITVEPQ